ncbi:hypothetical protein HDV00_004260 [Rhizophlyctis rosea]|nr:hypothetical protein HDV00_004260 [Rhizophlyctis rosea]
MLPRTLPKGTALLLASLSLLPTLHAQTAPLPDTNSTTSLTNLCQQMPGMPGCTIRTSCSSPSSTIPSEYCTPFSLLSNICSLDMPRMSDCAAYTSTCANSTTRCTGPSLSPLPSLPTSAQTTASISSICTEMSMDGCSTCSIRPNATYAQCDLLSTYAQLCKAMPNMRQCSYWQSMCDATPSLPYCTASTASDPVEMRMYFHTGIRDYILFKEWVPNTSGQYVAAIMCSILLGMVYEAFQVAHLTVERRRDAVYYMPPRTLPTSATQTQPATTSSSSSISSLDPPSASQTSITPLLRTDIKTSYRIASAVIRGVSRLVSASLAYIMMLVVMTYNVGLCIAIVVGLAIGSAVFGEVGRILAERDGVVVTKKVDEELCC